MDNFRISIISATYNAGAYLQRLIESVRLEKSSIVEFIIVDANSKDNTIQIITENASVIDQWISEPDTGIYDAWNKGLRMARGEWIMFLGADDQLIEGALSKYIFLLDSKQIDSRFVDLISSKVRMIDLNNQYLRTKGAKFHWPLFLKKMTIAHPGALHSKYFFEKYNLFDVSYKIVGDYEMFLRAGSVLNSVFMEEETVLMQEGGASDSLSAIKEHYRAVVYTAKLNRVIAAYNYLVAVLKFRLRKMLRKLKVSCR